MDATPSGAVRLHWREAGRGPQAVLFVHAFPFDGRLWDEQLARLPRRWRLIAPDLRGFGASEPGDADPFSMDLLADDLAALLERLDVPRAAICGLSMGGYVALALWRRHPERVRALALCDTRAAADSEEARRARFALIERIEREGAAAAADALLPRLVAERTRRERPELVDRLRAIILEQPPDTLVRALRGMADRPDSTPLLPGISVPTLVVRGAEDALVAPEEAEAMARAIPDARLMTIPGTGHLPNVEDPAAFDRVLVHFLEAVEGH